MRFVNAFNAIKFKHRRFNKVLLNIAEGCEEVYTGQLIINHKLSPLTANTFIDVTFKLTTTPTPTREGNKIN